MRKFTLVRAVALFACWCASSLLLCTPAHSEKIPALSGIPADLPDYSRAQLSQRKQELERELAEFQAAAAAFNAKEAKDQSDAEYEALGARRTGYIAKVKAFNKAVAESGTAPGSHGKASAYTIRLGTALGDFRFENSDGSIFTNSNLQAGRVVRVGTGTRLTTGPTGRLVVVLPDETVFTIGPDTDVIMDEFVFDPGKDNDLKKISARLLKGFFRWVTGTVARRESANMSMKLPVGAIGIRGTDFEANVEAGGSGYVKLFSGAIEITPRKGGAAFAMKEKTMVRFKPDGTFGRPEPIGGD